MEEIIQLSSLADLCSFDIFINFFLSFKLRTRKYYNFRVWLIVNILECVGEKDIINKMRTR